MCGDGVVRGVRSVFCGGGGVGAPLCELGALRSLVAESRGAWDGVGRAVEVLCGWEGCLVLGLARCDVRKSWCVASRRQRFSPKLFFFYSHTHLSLSYEVPAVYTCLVGPSGAEHSLKSCLPTLTLFIDPMALFLAIVLTVIASSSSNIGKAFQKEASRHLPPLNVADAKVPCTLSLSLSAGLQPPADTHAPSFPRSSSSTKSLPHGSPGSCTCRSRSRSRSRSRPSYARDRRTL